MESRPGDTGPAKAMEAPARRRFLKTAALGVAGASLAPAVWAQGSPDAPPPIPEWMKTPRADTAANPYGLPSAHEGHIVRKLSVAKQAQSASHRTFLEQLDGSGFSIAGRGRWPRTSRSGRSAATGPMRQAV